MKIFDSELTDRGTERKKVYISYGQDKQAKKQALKDFNEHRKMISMNIEDIKPYRHRNNSIDYWLAFERLTVLRYPELFKPNLYNELR